MRITQLEYFTKTIECGSITKAAKELYVSQPALTKSISSLEAEFSVRLIEREARGVRITAEGQEFYLYAKEVIAARNNLRNAFGPRKHLSVDRLRIASQQLSFLYPMLDEEYANDYSGVNVDLVEGDRSLVLDAVMKRRANIGLMIITSEDSAGFKSEMQTPAVEVHTLDHSTTYVSMCPSSLLYDSGAITVGEASKHLHMVLDMDQMTKMGMFTSNVNYHVDAGKLFFCNSIRACCHFMESQGALLYAPKWVTEIITAKDVRTLPLLMDSGEPYPKVNRLVWIKREGELLSPAEERFIHRLEERFSDDA